MNWSWGTEVTTGLRVVSSWKPFHNTGGQAHPESSDALVFPSFSPVSSVFTNLLEACPQPYFFPLGPCFPWDPLSMR